MRIWDAATAAKATGGKLLGNADWEVASISIDSRLVRKGDLFIALPGTKTDGHDFIREAFLKGAAAVMVERIPENFPIANASIMLVDNCIKALYKLAEYRRAESKAKIIAVTGSVGKTSTKEMLKIAFGNFGITHVSAGNNNNEIGAPLSLAKMPQDTEFGIFELGMNHANEITPLSKLIRPHIAIVTNVEEVHTENLGSLENIAHAKAEIFDGIEKKGTAILNHDSEFFEMLSKLAREKGARKIFSFGEHIMADAKLLQHTTSPGGNILQAKIGFDEVNVQISARGKHMAINALAVLAAVMAANQNVKEAAQTLSTFTAQKGRGQILQIPYDEGKITIIDESYNASPVAMRAALGNLGDIEAPINSGGRKIAVLGDMLELGARSAELHKALTADILRNNIDLVFTVGSQSKLLFNALPEKIRGAAVNEADDILPIIENTLKTGDVILVKASHGIGLGHVVEQLTKVKAHAV